MENPGPPDGPAVVDRSAWTISRPQINQAVGSYVVWSAMSSDSTATATIPAASHRTGRPAGPADGRRFGGLLRQRRFRLLWLGETVSQLGNAMALVGVPLVAVVVLHAFGPYSRGEMLTDPTIISAILSGGHASMVIPIQAPQHNAVGANSAQGH